MKIAARPVRLWLAIAALVGGVALGTSGCGGGSGSPTGAAGTGAAGTGAAGTGTAGTGTAGTGAAGTGAAGTGAAGTGAAGTGAAGTGAAGTGAAGTGAAGTGAAGTGAAGTGAAGTGAAGSTPDGGADAAVDKPATEGGTSTDGGAMTLTATLKMVDGGLVFPAANSAPMNQSPAIAWTGAPAGTMSFAWTIKDLNSMGVHFVLYDISPATTMLPANLPRGAMPAMPAGAIWKSAFGGTPGYEGPGGGGIANYELQLWALKVAKLNVGNMDLNQIYNTLLPMQKLDSAKVLARGKVNGL
jgi:phosphatidylethanolamine-binding protein (PEBP) family uncharacterized protein